MSCLPSAVRSLAGAALLIAGIVNGPSLAQAQEPTPETVHIMTVDGVKLKAVFYPSSMKSAPTVIMLHSIGDGRSMKAPEWKSLAESLQKAKYSVIMFDFRGHGDSTSIDDPSPKGPFWNKLPNYASVKAKERDTIEVKDYIKSGSVPGAYLPVLVNDIAAVRAYLDRRNDEAKDCNTSSLIVIGADSGATLGALWINAECYRYKYTPPMGFTKAQLSERAEGSDIIAAVFLTVQPTLEKRTVPVSGLLKTSCKDHGMAAAFFYGKDDAKSKDFAKTLEKTLKLKGKKHEYIGAVELNTKLTGMKLLQKGLGTETSIVKYLDSVVEERKNERVDRDFSNSFYMWRVPIGGGLIPAKNRKAEKNLIFDDYNKFITP
jgi:hypothetical protein